MNLNVGIRFSRSGRRLWALAFVWCFCLSSPASAQNPKNIILFIGDGMGFEHVKAANYYNGGNLSFENSSALPHRGQVTTYSANSSITDSAAAATAIATGFKVNNDVISVALPGDGRELETMLELFKKRGKSTGLITTTYPTHATPAGFGAHDPSRNNTGPIGHDLMTQTQPNILFGGGDNGLNPAMAAAYGYQVASNSASFSSLDPSMPKLCALFGSGYMPFEEDYPSGYPYPHLTDMVLKALAALEGDPDGFFLMVEGGKIDTAAHSYLLPEAVHETLELSRAVQAALNWMGSRTDTLFIVTADHETGGLQVIKDNGPSNYPNVSWSTTGHTGADVPVYAAGPRAELVAGIMDNTKFLRLVTLEGIVAPFLYRASVQDLSSTAATIVWNTDENCNSRVEIRPVGASVWTELTDANLTTTHNFRITALTPGTPYEYRVTSSNTSGSTTSESYTFTPPSTLLSKGAIWKYTTGTDLGAAWKEPQFNDTAWSSGPAQLGYGDGDEATLIASSPVRPCYYFRHAFTIENPGLYQALSLEVLRDDGAIVYLNGQEVARYNMLAGLATYNTWAPVSGEFQWDPPLEIPNLLVTGQNVLAVEVHQASSTSTDVSFDLELSGVREITVSLDSPAAGATGIQSPATLAATATDPEGQPLTVSFYGRQVPPPGADFVLVVLPDIQKYTFENPGSADMFYSQIDWILAKREASNIVYVSQLGDISDTGDQDADESEWFIAQTGFSGLEAALPAGIPYGLAVGNHDQLVLAGDTSPTTLYNDYFGISRFQGRTYYGGHYGDNNNNHYDFFSASELGFIVIYFEFDTTPDQAVLDWADALLKANPNRHGIVVTHYLLETTAAWGVQGQAIYEALKDNPNLFLMLCGHNHGEARRTDVYSGSTVHTLLADYQGYANGGDGFLRIMTFRPSRSEIRVQTYSPWTLEYETDAESEFTLNYAMDTGPAFQLIAQNTEVASGTQTTAAWGSLLPGTEYEWFVTATDGIETRTSEVRRFTTLPTTPPTVSITSPADDASFPDAPATFPITATASDSDGTVTGVEFIAGTTSLGVDSSAPYEVSATLPTGRYALTAVATDNAGAQSTSATVNVTVGVAPAAPSELTATAQSRTAILLTWEDNSSNESGFEIRQSLDDIAYALASTTGPNVNSAQITGLQPSTTYHFIVRAFNGVGYADSSAAANATTLDNQAPTSVVDAYSTAEDSPLVVAARGVLDNDTDADEDPLTASLVDGPANGDLTLNTDGSFTYTPEDNYSGADSFTYRPSDGYDPGPVTVVSISISAVNDPPIAVPDTATTLQGAPVIIDVVDNDSDIEGQALGVADVTQPANGSVIINPNGTVTYSPGPVFTGTDGFTYTVTDGSLTAQATVTVTVSPNVLFSDGFESGGFAAEGWVLTGTPVVDNTIAYPEGTFGAQLKKTATITKRLVGVALQTVELSYWRQTVGGVSAFSEISSDGVTWAPVETVTGAAAWQEKSFTITKAAGEDLYLRFRSSGIKGNDVFMVDAVIVTGIAPNGVPVATSDDYSVDEDQPLSVPAPGVLANDTDPEADPLAAILVLETGPAHGTLALNADGSFSYTPAPDYFGTDGFSYVATDGAGQSAPVAVIITVTPAQDLPVANPQALTVAEDVSHAMTLSGSDADGDSLSYAVISGPSHGTLSGTPPNLLYAPNADFYGADTFSFTVDDGKGGMASAAVNITVTPVNDTPVANGQSLQTAEDVSYAITLSGSDVDGDSLSYAVVSGPSHGTLSGTAPTLVYLPNPDFNGADSISFTVDDGNGGSASASVDIIITAVSDPPTPTDDTYAVVPNTTLHVSAPGLLGNDIDADGDNLTVILANSPSHGRLYVNADGSFSYIPNAGFSGADSFSYVVSDGTPNTSWATVTILVGEQTAIAMHVSSILVLSVDTGKRLKGGYAEVVIVDGAGNAVRNALVSGGFSGTISETLSAATDSFGKAVFQTTTTVPRFPRLTFTVSNVSQAGRTYDSAANLESSDSNY